MSPASPAQAAPDQSRRHQRDGPTKLAVAECCREVRSVVDGEIGGRISADGHEAGVPDRKLPGETVDEVERNGQGDRDSRQHEDAAEIRTNHAALKDEIQRIQHGDDDQSDDQITQVAGHRNQKSECRSQNSEARNRTGTVTQDSDF